MEMKNNNNIADFIWHFLCITIPAMTIISIIVCYFGNNVAVAVLVTILCATRIVSEFVLLALIDINKQYIKEKKEIPKEIYMKSITWSNRGLSIVFFVTFGGIGFNMFYSELLASVYLITAIVDLFFLFKVIKLKT